MLNRRIHIIGSTGSGKSFIAKKLSKVLAIEHYELDNIKYTKSNVTDKRVSYQERIQILKELTEQDEWIIEGVHHTWIQDSLEAADIIFFLNPNVWVRDLRIIKRFVLTRLNIDESNWKQSIKDVYTMITGNHKFEREKKPIIIDLLKKYESKTITLKNNKRIMNHLNSRMVRIEKVVKDENGGEPS
jgi:adenylate kinase family enzyme